MYVNHYACDAFVNDSEERAFAAVGKYLRGLESQGQAFVLTNLAHAIGRDSQPDEIDMVIVAPGAVSVIEVKHWDRTRLDRSAWDAEDAADLITKKAKRVAGRLRDIKPDLAYVAAHMLFTKEVGSLCQNGRLRKIRGVSLGSLADIEMLLDSVLAPTISNPEVEQFARALAPRAAAAATGSLKRIGRITDLKRLSPPEERFGRVYAGRDAASGERVTVHLFDLSASHASNAERQARREFEVIQKLQKSPYLPSLVESFQAVPNYPGELVFFTLAESAAPSLAEMARNPAWGVPARIAFAGAALQALAALHAPIEPDTTAVVHRNLNPDTVRIRANGTPLFAGWRWARLPGAQTVTNPNETIARDPYFAPEVAKNGLAFADARSDVYSLCMTLKELFAKGDETGDAVLAFLSKGLHDEPEKRASAQAIADALMPSAPPVAEEPAELAPQRWDEGHIIDWEGGRYRILSRLGEGGAGRTFKLEQLDGRSGASIGTFVGKVVINEDMGGVALDAYMNIRSIADHRSLSGVFQTASEWSPDKLLALLKWRKGEPLQNWAGDCIQLLAEDVLSTDANPQSLLLKWAQDLCAALDVMHAQGWVHGDVSPSNILVDGASVCLIDFDLACRVGEAFRMSGTPPYASPSRRDGAPAQPSDDVFALAASLFYALTGRSPFLFEDDVRRENAGLRWRQGERESCPILAAFLDGATDADPSRRFATAGWARRYLEDQRIAAAAPSAGDLPSAPEPEPLRPNVVRRVEDILRVYPGSRFGNSETRGLDSEFAADTYVETELDEHLLDEICTGSLSLVILCGNAGDGKTALLQKLAARLGIAKLQSEQRVWIGEASGRHFMINLDGAASWGGRSADDLMDEVLALFHDGYPLPGRVHLVAVNDGRLMEWVESYEARHGETRLAAQIADALDRAGEGLDPHVRLIELNQRSLVGGFNAARGTISTRFVDRLIARLVGGDSASEIWMPCRTCSAKARCSVRASAEMMGASCDDAVLAKGALLRRRLVAALQAVHQRDEVHITARELKAALSYILFGIHACEDMHANPALAPHSPADFAFDPTSPLRQGELLREMTRLDPGLEAHARIDRYLIAHGAPSSLHGAPRFSDVSLRRARRRAYLAWTDDQIEAVGGDAFALGLAQGKRFSEFRDFPLRPEAERTLVRDALCLGLSRLEALPETAFREKGVAPIRIVPRTPTETAFWVGKPFDRFSLEGERYSGQPGLETLHRHLTLTYHAENGREERLDISLQLFALLMDLADGMQILDTFSDDVFANLGVSTQRLAQEDERSLRAWTPSDEETVYEIFVEKRNAVQVIVLEQAKAGA